MKQILKWAFLVFILLCAFFSFTQVRKNVISGEINGLKAGDMVYLASFHNSIKEFVVDDSSVVKKDNEFSIKTYDKNEVVHLYFVPSADTLDMKKMQWVTVFLEGLGKYSIKADIDTLYEAKIVGGVYQYPEIQKINATKDDIYLMRKRMSEAYEAEKIDTAYINELGLKFDSTNKALHEQQLKLIATYPEDIHSAYYLNNLSIFIRDSLSYKQIDSLRSLLGEKASKSLYSRNVKKCLSNFMATSVGGTAPDFTLTTPVGDTLSLSDYSGKTVLLEFWASWCKPCRNNNPHLVQMYQKYHPMGLEVIGVACWDEADAWKKAIESDSLTWAQVNAEEKIKGQDNVADTYMIVGVPTTIIVDPSGKVIFRGHPSTVEEKLIEIFPSVKE